MTPFSIGSLPEGNDDSSYDAPNPVVTNVRWVRAAISPFRVLSNRDFKWLWFGMVGQASSMWAETVARNWLVWEMTHSGMALGLVNLCRAIPTLLLGVWGGVAADRFDKRKLLMVIQVWTLLVYLVMAILLIGDWIKLWHVYVMAAAMGAGMAFNQPVRTSFVPQLVPQKDLLSALSLNSVAINLSRLVGPAAIGLLIAFSGVGAAYVVSCFLYLGILFATMMIQSQNLHRTKASVGSMMQELFQGFGFLHRNRLVLMLVLLALGPLAFAFSYLTLLPIYSTEILYMGPKGFGSLQSVGSIGALIAGLTIASRGNIPRKGLLMLVTGAIYGITVMALGANHWALGAFLIIALASGAQTIFRAANNSSIFEYTPREFQGRVISITLWETGLQPVAAILAGIVSDLAGVSVAMAVIGVACLLITLLIGTIEPKIRYI
jgi:MFS family permease